MTVELHDSCRHDFTIDKVSEFEIIPLITESNLQFIVELINHFSQPGVICGVGVRAVIKILIECRHDATHFFNPYRPLVSNFDPGAPALGNREVVTYYDQ